MLAEQVVTHFNPRSPHGERQPLEQSGGIIMSKFQPTLPARGATQAGLRLWQVAQISTHAPRTGSDAMPSRNFSTSGVFQPTLPARGATVVEVYNVVAHNHFNPRSPHGERPNQRFGSLIALYHFNPRSPHGERHTWRASTRRTTLHFNPRSPHGERLRRRSSDLS